MGKELGFTDREICNLVAPLIAEDAENLMGTVIIGVRKDGSLQMAGNFNLQAIVEILAKAGTDAIASASDSERPALLMGLLGLGGLDVPPHEHDEQGNCIFPDAEPKEANRLEGTTADDLMAELGLGEVIERPDGKE